MIKYNGKATTIIDLRRFALIHNGDEEQNEKNFQEAYRLIERTHQGIKEHYYENEEEREKKEKMYETIWANIGDFIGYEVIKIEIEGYDCLTTKSNQNDGYINERVHPYDNKHRYPMQEIEAVYSFKQY